MTKSHLSIENIYSFYDSEYEMSYKGYVFSWDDQAHWKDNPNSKALDQLRDQNVLKIPSLLFRDVLSLRKKQFQANWTFLAFYYPSDIDTIS